MDKQHNLYARVVEITEAYLGPSAERFVARQIETHLNKSPETLNKNDMRQLLDWLRLALAFITEDEAILDEYADRLRKLISNHSQRFDNAHRN